MSEQKTITETPLGTMTFRGRDYEVFRLEGDTMLGYRLKGPRGADYSLLRNKPNPHMMFAMNTNNFQKKTAFEGRWFTDKDRQGNSCQLRLI